MQEELVDWNALEAMKKEAFGEGAEGEAEFREVLALFIQNADELVGKMQTALSQKEWETVRRTAHGLKGSSASVCVRALEMQCKELDLSLRDGKFPGEEEIARRVAEIAQTAQQAQIALRERFQILP